MDRIRLSGMRAWGRHGANPGEQDVPQPLDLDVSLEIALDRPGRTDALPDTVDYDRLHRAIRTIVAGKSYALLERLAEEIVAEIFRDERVTGAEVTIAKPGLLDGATPSVTLRRSR